MRHSISRASAREPRDAAGREDMDSQMMQEAGHLCDNAAGMQRVVHHTQYPNKLSNREFFL